MIDVRGKKATPSSKVDGDTTIEARLDGTAFGYANVIVIVPKKICGPCGPPPSSSSSSSSSTFPACPEGAERDPENLVLDKTTSPMIPVATGRVALVRESSTITSRELLE